MHSPAIDGSAYASMNGEVLSGAVAQQYAQQLALGLHQDDASTRSHSPSTDVSGDTSNVPTPTNENPQVNGNRASATTQNTQTTHQNGNTQQQMPHLGMALQQATGIEPQITAATNFPPFNNPDIFNFSNNSIIGYPVLGRMPFQGFDTKPDLQTIHTQMQMREAKPYKCTQCIKSFANSSYLSQHMRIHLGIKPFGPCQYCGKKFTQLSHLQQHIRTHTGEKPYKCKYQGCEKAFSQLSNLQSHSRCHQTDKPFKCNSCYKCFSDEQSLLEHIPKHKESKHLKVHICPFCGKSYTQATYLQKHMTKHADRTRNMRFPNGQEFTAETSALDLNTWNTPIPPMPEDPATQHAQQQLAFISDQFNASMMNVAAGQTTQTTTYPQTTTLNNGFAAFEHLLNFQRNNARGYLDQYQNNFTKTPTERPTGFNMITPLENIQRYTQQGGGNTTTATATAVGGGGGAHPQFQITGPMKPASY